MERKYTNTEKIWTKIWKVTKKNVKQSNKSKDRHKG